MGSINEALRDAEVSHSVDLEQYKAGVVRRLIALLNRTDSDLAAQIAVAVERLPAGQFNVDRLESLLGSVRGINAQAYAAVNRELTQELRDFAGAEAGYQNALFADVLPVNVSFARVTTEQVYAAAYSQPMRGRLLREWSSGIEADRMVRIRDAIRLGYVEAQTVSQIVQRVRGTRAKGYKDGIIEIDRRAADAVVRTAIAHVAATARDVFNRENGDLVKAVAWTSTIDLRTTVHICAPRDGKLYHPVTHKPIGHSLPWMGGAGRAHWRCRSVSVPVLKSFRDLGIPVDEFDPGTRASMDGQIPADQTYGQWLQKQSAARQDQVVGPERGKLMRAGQLPFDSLYTDRGAFISLEELKQRHPGAFKRAGA